MRCLSTTKHPFRNRRLATGPLRPALDDVATARLFLLCPPGNPEDHESCVAPVDNVSSGCPVSTFWRCSCFIYSQSRGDGPGDSNPLRFGRCVVYRLTRPLHRMMCGTLFPSGTFSSAHHQTLNQLPKYCTDFVGGSASRPERSKTL